MALVPKINLRLTDEEHEALKEWAQDSHRSMQREAVFRLFSDRSLSRRADGDAEESGVAVVGVPSIPARSENDFKGPDFK